VGGEAVFLLTLCVCKQSEGGPNKKGCGVPHSLGRKPTKRELKGGVMSIPGLLEGP